MKSFLSQLNHVLMAGAMSTLMASAAFAGKQDFILHNETGVEIHEVYVSPSDSDDWQEDILGEEDTLPDGESVAISFNDREKTKKWDIRVTDGEEGSIDWTGLDLTRISEVTLHYKKGKAWADVK
jgi:hypothetical protein